MSIIGPPLNSLLMDLTRPQQENHLGKALARAAKRRVPINSVIDIGASDGRWSQIVRGHLPRVPLALLDGNPIHEPALRAFAAKHPPAAFRIAAAGPKAGKIKFLAPKDPFAGAVSAGSSPDEIEVDQVTIDSVVAELQLPPPHYIKLDTHGYEVEILQGAAGILNQTSLIQIEVYNFRLREGVLTFPEMCIHMDKLGFRLSDLFELFHRPSDGVLWQADAFFEPKSAPWWKNESCT